VRDLIKKLLDPNPMNRIRFHEIKVHPWIRDAQPLFDIFGFTRVEAQKKINESVFQHLLTLNFDFKNSSEDKIREALRKRRDHSFVVGYDLLLDDFNNNLKNLSKYPRAFECSLNNFFVRVGQIFYSLFLKTECHKRSSGVFH
jgi:serine/threonine protein kinase